MELPITDQSVNYKYGIIPKIEYYTRLLTLRAVKSIKKGLRLNL